MKTTFITSLFFAGAIAAPTAPAKRDLGNLKAIVAQANGIINSIEGTVNGAVANGGKIDEIIPGVTTQLEDLNTTLSGINVGGFGGVGAEAAVSAGVGVVAGVTGTITAALNALLGISVDADVDVDAAAAVSIDDISVGVDVMADLLVSITGMVNLLTGVPGLVGSAGGVADGGRVGAIDTAMVEGTVEAAVQISVSLLGSIMATVTGALNILGLGSITSIVPVPV